MDTLKLGKQEVFIIPKSRPPYPAEYREQILELAEEFEPTAQTIRNWLVQSQRDAGERSDGLTSNERAELQRLRRENKQLTEELEIVKKTATSFAREIDEPKRKKSSGSSK